MLASTLYLSAFAALATAVPTRTNLEARAGGPVAKPIPSTCTIAYPIPTFNADPGYLPAPSTSSALFYGAYYPSPSSNKTALAEQCLQQCYGYGDSTECKAAYWAENVEVPKGYYGSPGGTYDTACLFYNRTLTTADFIVAPEGNGTTPYAADLSC